MICSLVPPMRGESSSVAEGNKATTVGAPTLARDAEEGIGTRSPAAMAAAAAGSLATRAGAVAVGPPGPAARTALERIVGPGSSAKGLPTPHATPEADDPAQSTTATTGGGEGSTWGTADKLEISIGEPSISLSNG